MERDSRAPIACTLQPGDYRERLAWIAELARDGLLDVSRDDLRLELRYAPHVADRVREMVDALFDQFVPAGLSSPGERGSR